MENASKALIMAASVLLGLMIMSVGVALFNSFSGFGKETTDKIYEKQVSEFNNNYLKYYGNITYEDEKGKEKIKPIEVTAHDIVSVANHAKQNNINYGIEENNKYDENSYYVQVKVDKKNQNFEKMTEQQYINFIKENTENGNIIYYKCTNVIISETTKRVICIEFKEI